MRSKPNNPTPQLDDSRQLRYVLQEDHFVTVTLESDRVRLDNSIYRGRLIDLSENGAKLELPKPVAVDDSLRIKLAIDDLGVELYVMADVCWSEPVAEDTWQLGCKLQPAIPKKLFDCLADRGSLDRRSVPRLDETVELNGFWELEMQSVPVFLQNYSRGGFRVLTQHPGKPGQRLHLSLGKNGKHIVVANVRWRMNLDAGYLVGCRLLNKRDFVRLQQLCAGIDPPLEHLLCGIEA
jgi:hypothetical protein